MAARQKIGVLTFHRCINYGSYWQARCLVEGLRARGADAELLDHDCRHVAIAELRCAFQPELPQRTPRRDFGSYASKARKFFRAFEGLPLSSRFPLHQPEALEGYDTIVIGSDEVWNLSHPWYGGKPIFYGVGIRTPRLISYAASFGSYSCHWGIDEYWARQLDRFDALSVRDDNSYWLVRGATSNEPEVVLDPCLQFPEPAKRQPARSAEPYAIVYGHGFPRWFIEAVRRWSIGQGVRLIALGYRSGWTDEQRVSAAPEEFAQLIGGAKAVITNFFHGCVFALLNAKPFVTVPSEYRFNKVRDLTALLGAQRHMVAEEAPASLYEELLSEPLAPHIGRRIAEHRARSSAFLDAALA